MSLFMMRSDHPKRPTRAHPEQDLQRAIVQYLRAVLLPPTVFTAFPAGGGGRVRGAFLRATGLSSGWPDLQLVWEGIYHGLELKGPNGRLTAAQHDIHNQIRAAGGHVAVVRSIKDVQAAVALWGIPRREVR